MEFEVYKVTAINEDGKEVVAYATPSGRRMLVRSMISEYGNAQEEGMMMADLPEGATDAVQI